MGLFSKKADPIASREKALSKEIAALEAEIRQLNQRPVQPEHPRPNVASQQPALPSHSFAQEPQTSAKKIAPREPIFESVEQAAPASTAQDSRGHYNDLGVRKYDIAAAWRRIQSIWKGPSAHNPKLVSYLAAGSIRGLRPLRYEKRIARNRFIALTIFFLLILLALVGLFRP